DTGGLVGDSDRRVRGVHALSARPGGTEHVDLQVLGIDLDVDLLRLGEHGYGGGRGMDPPARLGHRDALDPVDPGLVLETRVRALAFDLQDDLSEPTEVRRARRQDVRLPPPSL